MSEQEEVEEHIHHAKEPFDKLVAGTMAAIAALLAIVSVLGQHFNTEKLLRQQLSSDQWAFYQAKNIRRYVAGATVDLLTQTKADPKSLEKYSKDSERYEKDMESIKEKAEALEKQSESAGERAESFHMGEVFLEIGIVLSSLAILTKQRGFYYAGAISSAIGLVLAIRAYLPH
jgi:chromosome segregation ATPase